MLWLDVGISPGAWNGIGSVVTPPLGLTLNLIFCPTVLSITPSSPSGVSINTAGSFAAPTVNPASANLTILLKFAAPAEHSH